MVMWLFVGDFVLILWLYEWLIIPVLIARAAVTHEEVEKLVGCVVVC